MSDYWIGRKVLVTGADGFIGSHLTERLVSEGARVRAFVYYNSFAHLGWLHAVKPDIMADIEIFPGDVRDPNRTLEAVTGQEVVFHLASLIAIPYSYHAPESYVQTNVNGGLNVLNACRRCGTPRLIHTSTSEVYGTAQYVPIDESHPLQGQSPYAATKIATDMLALSFNRSFELPVSIVRPFNTYGPRQSTRAVIPTILSQLLNGADTLRLGSLAPTRDFNFVADTVSGFLSAASCRKTIGEVFNVGSGREISIGDLVKLIFQVTGKQAAIVTEDARLRPEKSEVERLCCNSQRLRELTDWKPAYTLEAGIKHTADWIEDNLHHFRPDEYTL